MDMNMTMNSTMTMSKSMSYMHMTLFWGKNTIILFRDWPGSRTGMYVLALIIVFAFAFMTEWLSHSRLISPNWNKTAAELTRASLHMVRMGLYYLLMLALMSFNGGVVIVSILGHAVAFIIFGRAFFKRETCSSASC
ncbi:hypothetical protein LUZ60_005181 [Juncus effusus]|nr:hypothetical protein LUZ60_005181 [Juncus effusus]